MLNDSSFIGGTLTIRHGKPGQLNRCLGPFKNKFVSSDGYGRNLIIRALAGDATYPIAITSASLGDGNTAPADGNTALGNSLVSGLSITNMVVSNNVLTVDVFVPDASLPNDTYEEFGLFAGARLLARILISPGYTKATGEDTLFTYTLTLQG